MKTKSAQKILLVAHNQRLAPVYKKAKEIAKIINSSSEAVYANLNRARKKLTQIEHFKVNNKKESDYLEIQIDDSIIDQLIQGFRNKNPKQIASLLNENVKTDIIHSGIEYGKNETIRNSLKDWSKIAHKQQQISAKYIELRGKPVIVEFENKEGELCLNNIHYVLIENESIVLWKFYCFSWNLMNLAAHSLGVRLNAEYYYKFF
ncbi:hypothetical protein [Virgibacillus proomii]|uniref:hypothetical protein n=1 Tax=Virgibacillus proomii TaxID=84407 RepID=UPI001C116548|nr:hypothetical protein [Virgibacillus proomii]MBU5267691.1 hypothetical protein [Virgibacillus proomii]